MLFPTGHENLEGRRWPYWSIAFVALNSLVFLATQGTIERDYMAVLELKRDIVVIYLQNPRGATPEVEELVQSFETSFGEEFKRLQQWTKAERAYREDERAWNRRGGNAALAEKLRQLEEAQARSVVETYAFSPTERRGITYVTANFLHGGWLHLIFNMWFLWLAGAVLEDAWGRFIYPIFYFASGAAALYAHAAMFPDNMLPVIGASGAVAGLMGAFLIRFPRTRINFVFMFWFGIRPFVHRFRAPAYFMLPLWLITQLFWASVTGEGAGVAYWAHIGGFVFGGVLALGLWATGVEKRINEAIEAEVAWSHDPRLVKAVELIDQDQPAPAVAQLQELLREQPGLADAYTQLLRVHRMKNDAKAEQETLATLCNLSLKNKSFEAAWDYYLEYQAAGGKKLPGQHWLKLCRALESQQHWVQAAQEYEKLANAHSDDRISIVALVAAAQVHMKRLDNRFEAARLYKQAQVSPLPHRDWETTIRQGLAQAQA